MCLPSLSAAAPPVPTDSPLKDVLFACDRALNTCQGALEAKEAVLQGQARQLEALTAENTRLREQDDKLLSSPLLYYVLGMLTTGVVVHLVKPAK
jgi:hypothetical protein